MPDFRFQHYDPAGTATAIYGVLFSHAGTALKLTAGDWALAAYVKADHALFAAAMTEDAQRERYWKVDILEADITLPYNNEREPYFLEIWRQVGGSPNRDNDVLLSTYQYHNVAPQYLYTGNIDVGYDSSDNTLRMLMFLERDHELVAPKSVTVGLYFRNDEDDDITVFTQTLLEAAISPQGQFNLVRPDTELSPDRCYFVKVAFTAQDDSVHNAGAGLTTWD
jgi:hypothetical protein